MPISADQWRVVIGCNNVRRHRQIDLKRFCLEKMILGGSSIQLDLSDLSQLDAVVQEVRKDAETSHSATLNDFISDDSLDELSVILMTVCCQCIEVLQCFLSMVKLQLLQLAGDVETNPGPGTETPEYKTIVLCTKVLTDSIAHGVSGISGSLFSLSIISNETYQEMMNTSRTGHNKASILIDDLSNGIKLNPETFHKFVAALKEDGPWTENIVSHVLEAHSNIKASAPPQSQRTPPNCSADESRRIVNDIARRHGVDSLLDQKCTDYHILPISKCIVHWNAYGQYLGLSPQHIHAIDTNRLNTLPNSKTKEMLHKWQEMCPAIKCTYRYLLQGIIEVENNRRLVGDICTIIAEPSPSCTNDKAGSDDVIPKISPNPHKRADKPQSVKADEPSPKRARETEPFKEDDVPQAFCELPPPSTVETQSSEEGVDGARAQVATGKLWPINHGKDALYFYIINRGDLARVDLNPDNITSWANEWCHHHVYSKVIPKLYITGDSTKSDIRIRIDPDGKSWSKIGVDAVSVDKSKPTMVLGLRKGYSNYNQHIVIHEFGHALGLEHEHQRSIFWSVAKKFIDVGEMRRDERLKNTDINGDYLESLRYGDGSDKYDPDSVMHYWFNKKWLNPKKYRDEDKVKNDRSLSDTEKEVILGIHKRHLSCAVCPSPTDFAFLAQCYGKNHRENQPQLIVSSSSDDFESLQRDNAGSPVITIDQLIEEVICLARVISKPDIVEQLKKTLLLLKSKCTKVGIIGVTTSGKSTTINAMLGEEYLPTRAIGETAYVLCIKHDSNPTATLYDKTPLADNKKIATEPKNISKALREFNSKRRNKKSPEFEIDRQLELHVPVKFFQNCSTELEIYDTPGTSEKIKSRIYEDAQKAREEIEGMILVLSVDTLQQNATAELLKCINDKFVKQKEKRREKRRILVLMNKKDFLYSDGLDDTKETLKNVAEENVPVPWEEVVFYSAQLGLQARKLKVNPHVQKREFDIVLHAAEAIPEIKNDVEEINTFSPQNVQELARLAEEGSDIKKVEESLKKSCPRFKVLKAIDDTRDCVAELLEYVKQQITRETDKTLGDRMNEWSDNVKRLEVVGKKLEDL